MNFANSFNFLLLNCAAEKLTPACLEEFHVCLTCYGINYICQLANDLTKPPLVRSVSGRLLFAHLICPIESDLTSSSSPVCHLIFSCTALMAPELETANNSEWRLGCLRIVIGQRSVSKWGQAHDGETRGWDSQRWKHGVISPSRRGISQRQVD